MIQLIKKYWAEKPLVLILGSAIFFRMLAVLFSKGFGMFDDHFLVIEIAQTWVDKIYGYNNWLPFGGSTSSLPSGHSLFYTGLHFLLFKGLEYIGILDPQTKMYIVRFLHALLSLLTVYYGYKIAEFYGGLKVARTAGILLSLLWFMPMLSVRNLVEVVCVPFLIIPIWLIIKNGERQKFSLYLIAGLLAGIAFSIRFQSSLFIFGIGLVLLLEKKIKPAFYYGLGAALTICLFQGVTDYMIWRKPFCQFMEYVHFNATHPNDFVTHGWEIYVLLVSGIVLPPVGLFLWFGYFRNWKKQLILFLPSFLFFAFHSYFPNKQERFIFPFIPIFIILGCIGWTEFVNKSAFWIRNARLLRNCWIFFWALNLIPLLLVSVAYSKRNRVEAMTYLSHKKVTTLIIEDSNNDDIVMPPLYYMRKFTSIDWGIYKVTNVYKLRNLFETLKTVKPEAYPNYVILWGEDNIHSRVDSLKKYFPQVAYEATIEPGLVDKIAHFMNPVNKNETTYIYKLN